VETTEHNTMAATANVWPHKHRDKTVGPYDVRIGSRSQPDIVRAWSTKFVRVGIEQTEEDTNFTLLRVVFLKQGRKMPWVVAGVPLKRVRLYRRKSGEVSVRTRKRMTDKLTHPLPTGRYVGSCIYDVDGGFAVFTLQALTLKKEGEVRKPKTIITPGDPEYGKSLAELERAFPRPHGLDGGGADAGRLRHG